jgi:hypothetical protein
VDIIHKYTPDEVHNLKTMGELPCHENEKENHENEPVVLDEEEVLLDVDMI